MWLLPPPRIHRHRYHGVFAPNAPLRPLITERAHQDNALAAQLHGPAFPLPVNLTASPPEPEAPPPQTRGNNPSQPSTWATLLARIYEAFPLVWPAYRAPLTLIAFLTHPEPITRVLAHIVEPPSPPLLHPARGPPAQSDKIKRDKYF